MQIVAKSFWSSRIVESLKSTQRHSCTCVCMPPRHAQIQRNSPSAEGELRHSIRQCFKRRERGGLVQFIPYENWFHALLNTSGLVFVHLTPGPILLNPSTIRPRALVWATSPLQEWVQKVKVGLSWEGPWRSSSSTLI